jgi:hypothetical protein
VGGYLTDAMSWHWLARSNTVLEDGPRYNWFDDGSILTVA